MLRPAYSLRFLTVTHFTAHSDCSVGQDQSRATVSALCKSDAVRDYSKGRIFRGRVCRINLGIVFSPFHVFVTGDNDKIIERFTNLLRSGDRATVSGRYMCGTRF